MNYQTFHLTATVGSTATRALVPGDGFSETLEQRRVDQEALSGRLHSYRWPAAALGYALPLTPVDSATRADLTHWWRDQRELALTFNFSSAPETAVVRIVNGEEPLGRQVPGVPDRFTGALMLREVRANGKVSGLFFLLDDSAYGLLDQPLNPLI